MLRPAHLAALALALLCASCAAGPPAETPEELLFSVPSWCSWGKKRQGWATWATSRRGDVGGAGICGTRLPLGKPPEGMPAGKRPEPGVCVEVQGGEVSRVTLRDEKGRPLSYEEAPVSPGSAWRELRTRGEGDERRVHVRVDGRALHAYVEGSGEQVSGPCFYRELGD